ncbi:MAG: flagellar hook-basal body complex protein, partial [Phycisphaerales bacterium]|nr:flagellar hook-basal body complex protein [Phycisphaerales bacterium]
LFSSLSGLNVETRRLDVIGNNIANVNTTAFKGSRMFQANQNPRTFSLGSEPTAELGGSNPMQVGTGTMIASIQRDMGGGTLSPTGSPTDVAIDGAGFFVLRGGEDRFYSRAGAFTLNENNELVTVNGERVQGWGVNDSFEVQRGQVGDVTIELGSMTIAQATSTVRFDGVLDAGGNVAQQGSRTLLSGGDGLGLAAIGGAPLTAETTLVGLEDPLQRGTGAAMFAEGQTIQLGETNTVGDGEQVRGAEKGGRTLPVAQLAITAATTIADFMGFLSSALGIQQPIGQNAGVALDEAAGQIVVTGNPGEANSLAIETGDLVLLDETGQSTGRNPFAAQTTREADGESQRTPFFVYDSLGSLVLADLTMVMEQKTDAGTTWRYYVESDEAEGGTALTTGLIEFDTNGNLRQAEPVGVVLNRDATGAAQPLAFDLLFQGDGSRLQALDVGDGEASIAVDDQDGLPAGTLNAFGIGPDGIISGAFTNGLSRPIGQIALASFANDKGLSDAGNNLFRAGPNSGDAVITEPGGFGTGRTLGGQLEQSNIDLSREFIGLILAQTGYTANARVIRTTDELLQQLVVLGR